MYCPSCGALNDGGALCMTCGRELEERRAPPVIQRELVPEPVVVPEPAPAPIEHPCAVHPDMPVGGTCARCGKFICARCSPGLAEGRAQCPDCAKRETAASDGEGIGGWLALPAIGIVLIPLFSALEGVGALARGNLFGAVIELAVAGYGGFTAVQFFARKRQAPLFMLGFYGLNLVVSLMGDAPVVTSVWALAWIAYFLTSQRVKRTFVK